MSGSVAIGMLGLGGYGSQHLGVLEALRESGDCHLVAVGDPFAEKFEETAAALRARGVEIRTDPAAVIEDRAVEALIIATPIHLHAPQTIAALGAAKHVYVEKPPCATLEEFEAMLEAQAAAGKLCAVGFQNQTSPAVNFVKRRMMEGDLGRVRRIWSSVRWKRTDKYYARSPWAARWSVDGWPVFDGPATNALAHVVNGATFLAGAAQEQWAKLARVRGCLRRARPVESYDTAYLEAETEAGVNIRLAFTHACAEHDEVMIHCEGDGGRASVTWGGAVELAPHNGAKRRLKFPNQARVAMTLDFLRAVRGANRRPAAPLADMLAYMQMVNGAYHSSGGSTSFDESVIQQAGAGEERCYTVKGLDEAMAAFARDGESIPPVLTDGQPMPWLAPEQIGRTLDLTGGT